jgi:polyisoprenoid-binding protein YceI
MISTQDPANTFVSTADRIPAGLWSLDSAASEVEFTAKTFWGLVAVHGCFSGLEGNGQIDDDGLTAAQLSVDVASVDTKLARRDEHLRASKFFHAERYPHLEIAVRDRVTGGGQPQNINGEMTLRGRTVPVAIEVAITVAPDGKQLEVRAAIDVDRKALGMGSGLLGMVGRNVQGRARLVFRRTESARA